MAGADVVGADGDYDLVGLDLGDKLGGDGGVQVGLDAHALDLLDLPLGGGGHLLLLRSDAGEQELAAQLVGGLVDDGLVAAGLEYLGRHHAAHAAADYHDLLRALGLLQALVLEAGQRVAGAGDGLEARVDDGVIAALVAADALADELGVALLGLLDPLGIGDLAAADADQVHLALGYQLVGELGGVDTADAHDGDADLALDFGYVLHVEAGLQQVGRDFVHGGEAHGVAAGEVNDVDAQLGAAVDEVHYLLLGHVLLHELVDGVAAHEEGMVSGMLARISLMQFQTKRQRFSKLAAVLVGAVVGAGAEHLVGQVAVAAVQLDDVKAGVNGALGGLAELLLDLLQALDGERIGGLELVALVKEELGREAAVPELDAHRAADGVDGVGELAELLNVLVGVEAHVHVGVRLRTDSGDLENVQGAAGLGLGDMVGYHVLPYLVLVAYHLGVHAWQDHPVFQLQPTDFNGVEQCFVAHLTRSF